MAQETLSWQREGLSRRHTRRYCGSERGSTMAARAALSSRQRIRRDPRETVSRWHARLHHGSRKMPIIAADSILQREGETISRRHERGCVLSPADIVHLRLKINHSLEDAAPDQGFAREPNINYHTVGPLSSYPIIICSHMLSYILICHHIILIQHIATVWPETTAWLLSSRCSDNRFATL